MSSIKAKYENGVFRPLEDVPMKEGTEVDVYPRGEHGGNGKKPKSVRDLAVYGMWKDREDIGTGADYVSRIREYPPESEK